MNTGHTYFLRRVFWVCLSWMALKEDPETLLPYLTAARAELARRKLVNHAEGKKMVTELVAIVQEMVRMYLFYYHCSRQTNPPRWCQNVVYCFVVFAQYSLETSPQKELCIQPRFPVRGHGEAKFARRPIQPLEAHECFPVAVVLVLAWL